MKIELVWVAIGDPNESTEVNHPNSQRLSPAKPVKLGEWIVPDQIKCEFLIKGLQSRVNTLWRVEIVIQIENHIPHTKRVSVSVEGKSGNKKYPHAERIEVSHLALTSSNLREFEAKAIEEMRKWYEFNSESQNWKFLPFGELTAKETKAIRKETLNRTAYRTLDDQFLKEIARLFIEAERKGERTNKYIANEIGRRENIVRSAKTAEKWIAKARKKGILAQSNRKESSVSPRKQSKKTTTAKKGKAK